MNYLRKANDSSNKDDGDGDKHDAIVIAITIAAAADVVDTATPGTKIPEED